MIRRLSEMDLSGRTTGRWKRWALEIAVGVGLTAVAIGLRLLIGLKTPNTLPFALLYPAMLLATLVAGWRAGAVVVGLGAICTFLMMHANLTGSGISYGLFLFAGAAVVSVANAYRRSAQVLGEERLATIRERDLRLTEYRNMFQQAPGFICILRGPDFQVEFANQSFLGLIGRTEAEGLPLIKVMPEVREIFLERLRRVMKTGEPFVGTGLSALIRRTPDGPLEERLLDLVYQPMRGANGEVSGIFVEGFDTTDRHRTEQALRESEARLDLATAAGGIGVWEWRPSNHETVYSERAKAIFGFPPGEPVVYEQVVAATYPGDQRWTWHQAADPDQSNSPPVEYRIVWPDGTVRWIQAQGVAAVETDADGAETLRYVGTVTDITERKSDEERLQLLAREVDHRANNLLAVIQSTVALTQAPTADALRTAIIGRLTALARAHQLIAAARWQGADLMRIVREELAAFGADEPSRVTIQGDIVAITPMAAQSVGMAVHELATNAVKYGALSSPDGHLTVSWTTPAPGEPLVLRWIESGGPPVTPPTRRGLGSKMLARILTTAEGGGSRFDWRPEGLIVELDLPPDALAQGPT